MDTSRQHTVREGLAIYAVGEGEPLLLMPYPHASTTRPMAETPLAHLLVGLGRRVITFDPPGSFRSTRPLRGDMAEMIACAVESLDACRVEGRVDVVGHSMGSLCALGLTLEQPERVRRLVLVGSMAGFSAVMRWSLPHNWRWWRDREFWQCLWYGTLLFTGWGNLETHKRLDNLVELASVVDKTLAEIVPIDPDDRHCPMPPRSIWARTVRRMDYRARLGEVRAPTLICVGRHDPQTPVACNQELAAGILHSRLAVFERSGHAPFLEEPEQFANIVRDFLKRP